MIGELGARDGLGVARESTTRRRQFTRIAPKKNYEGSANRRSLEIGDGLAERAEQTKGQALQEKVNRFFVSPHRSLHAGALGAD